LFDRFKEAHRPTPFTFVDPILRKASLLSALSCLEILGYRIGFMTIVNDGQAYRERIVMVYTTEERRNGYGKASRAY